MNNWSTHKNRHIGLFSVLVFGFAFLYIPIILVIFYSFNHSKLVTVWGGFSFKWYAKLLQNPAFLEAAYNSLRIGVFSATLAVILGTVAAFTLVRFKKFKGKNFFTAMISAPLVMPEVIIGLSLLLLFVSFDKLTEALFGWSLGRGITTITLAHTTLCMAYVAVVVQVRLSALDIALEEAAMDLGAKPLQVFFTITFPQIRTAMIAGWFLAFSLSLDDLVIASFVTGSEATTLPIKIFSSIRLGLSPEVNVLATFIVLIVTLCLVVTALLMRKKPQSLSY